MANQVAARLSGDDYQHLYAWLTVLELKMPRKDVARVTVEDEAAGSVDDVTVIHEAASKRHDKLYQIKYHVDQRSQYSTDVLLEAKGNETSLLQKFWRTWVALRAQRPDRPVELHLISNWTWDAQDKIKSCIDGRNNAITDDFFASSPKSDIGKLRKRWQEHLKAPDEDFALFIGSLRFRLGFDCSDQLEQRTAERMEWMGLRSDSASLLVATGIVRTWIKDGKQELSSEDLERTLRDHDLYLPASSERGTVVYLSTVKKQQFDLGPDYHLDWREHFEGAPNRGGHQLLEPNDWNATLLPQLYAVETAISEGTTSRLIRARGLSRLSAWFAFGYAFSDVARYTIEIDQNGSLWRTDATPAEDFTMTSSDDKASSEGEALQGDAAAVAVGISVTGLLDEDVRMYLSQNPHLAGALLLLRPERELGRECLRDAGDAAALAVQTKERIRTFVKAHKATKLLLFYFGPLGGACFIGHRFNAVCRQIQIMEDQRPSYAPSFLLG